MKNLFKFVQITVAGAVLAVAGAFFRFQRMVHADTRRLFAAAGEGKKGLVTADMLSSLPEPVRRYLVFSGIVGKPFIQTVRLMQRGRFRRGTDQPWMDIDAEEYYSTNPPGLVWAATFRMAGLPLLKGYDRYQHAQGHMQGLFAALYPIFSLKGEKLTQATMLRYLNEMVWFPSAFLEDYISWANRDDHSTDVTFTDNGKSVTATMFFNPEGRLTNFVTQRYREVQGDFSLDTWSTPLDAYGEMNGLRLPVRGKAVWHLPEGDLTYAEMEITEVEYDRPEPYPG